MCLPLHVTKTLVIGKHYIFKMVVSAPFSFGKYNSYWKNYVKSYNTSKYEITSTKNYSYVFCLMFYHYKTTLDVLEQRDTRDICTKIFVYSFTLILLILSQIQIHHCLKSLKTSMFISYFRLNVPKFILVGRSYEIVSWEILKE